jgi:PAS domain S-box-containing protein
MEHLLIIEDDKVDQMAFERSAKSEEFPYSYTVVNSIKEANKALKSASFDLIVSDFYLGDGTTFDILDLNYDIPIVVITGTGSEEIAVSALKKGAYDYLMKDIEGYYLKMLPITVKNALHRFKSEQELKKYQQNLEKLVKTRTTELNKEIEDRKLREAMLIKMKQALNNSNEVIFMTNKEGVFTFTNPQFTKMYGYTNKEIVGKVTPRILKSGVLKNKEYVQLWQKLLKKESVSGLVYKNKSKNGKLIDVESSIDPILNDKNVIIGFMGIQRDITERIDASEALHKRESLLNAIFESTGDGMLVVDNNGKVTHRNTEFNSMWKIPPKLINTADDEKLIAFVIDQLESPNHFVAKIKELYNSTKSDRDILNFKDGRVFERNSEPLVVNNIVFGRVWGFKDISERKHAEKLQKVLYNISNAVIKTENLNQLIGIIQNELGLVLDTSNFYVAFYDQETDKFSAPFLKDEKIKIDKWNAGKSLSAYVVKNNKPLLITKNEILKMQQAGTIENVDELAEVWMGVPLKSENSLYGILAVQSYKSENAYSKADLEILSFVSEHISTSIYKKQTEDGLIKALEKATESDRLKTSFLQNISHEIRTPMNGILGFASLLKNQSIEGEKQQKYIEIITKSGTRMLNTLNDLMDISRLETQQVKLSYSETNVNHELGNLYAFFKPEAERNGLLLSFHTFLPTNEAYIITDHQKFFATLSNLIKNSIKYTPHGSIDFGYKLKNNTLEFYVKDTGIGIPLDRQQAIFDRFVQADIEDTKVFEGVGLGLSISKSYIEMLEGKIWVDSVENEGSNFYFTIPYKTTESEVLKSVEQKSGSIKNTALNKLKVLIAEDEESAFLYLDVVLENLISSPLRAKNGLEAVQIAKNNPDLDLILMDIKMPVMGGYEATREIRKFNKEVIIIAETAYALPGDRDKALESGCNDYIAKPINDDKLLKLIKKFIKKKAN